MVIVPEEGVAGSLLLVNISEISCFSMGVLERGMLMYYVPTVAANLPMVG